MRAILSPGKIKALINNPKKAFIFFLLALFIYVITSLGNSQKVELRIISVADGDTVTAIRGKRRIKIRLHGIDAPEIGQKYGYQSRAFLSKMVKNKKVKIKIIDTDKYDRKLAVLYVSGKDINKLMVANGYAWAYKYYTKRYLSDQKSAKAAKKGLWRDKNPQEPYKYRREHK